ncbi:transglycosylase SLT domain-containing protein [Candidatus Pantoea multigeneris]|uniref:peptidoglycan lytic exotransglycosylase n=1 Tax=Candidatus Pantoea multigeneris TaxID=2608357 RepID=A0ABX0RBZ8_9GAMM|nr:transglycosylase SLT domain-containing protein [Pantoea multigeneris]
MKIRLFVLSALFLTGCASQAPHTVVKQQYTPLTQAAPTQIQGEWSLFTATAATHYGIDERLLSAIISVESGGNPDAISRSHAVGLMQIKASTAGRAVYHSQGRRGQPTTADLRDPARNIDIGAAYIKILQDRALAGIENPLTLRYATIVSYANGAGALLRTFSRDRSEAIAKINALTPEQFYHYVQTRHPAAQAPRYLWKVTTAYRTI